MYHFNWRSPVAGGAYKSTHTMEIGFMFDNVEGTIFQHLIELLSSFGGLFCI